MESLVNFFKFSAPYIKKDMRDVGEVPTQNLESFRSLIIDVEMFLDLFNVIEKIFEIVLLQKELSVSLHLPLKFFVCFCT